MPIIKDNSVVKDHFSNITSPLVGGGGGGIIMKTGSGSLVGASAKKSVGGAGNNGGGGMKTMSDSGSGGDRRDDWRRRDSGRWGGGGSGYGYGYPYPVYGGYDYAPYPETVIVEQPYQDAAPAREAVIAKKEPAKNNNSNTNYGLIVLGVIAVIGIGYAAFGEKIQTTK